MFYPPFSLCCCRLGRELVVQLTYWLCLPPTLLRPATPSGRALWVSLYVHVVHALQKCIVLSGSLLLSPATSPHKSSALNIWHLITCTSHFSMLFSLPSSLPLFFSSCSYSTSRLATWPPSVAFYPTLNTTLVSKRMLRRYLRRLWPQALLFKITSSLLKLANCSTHGGETWCSCVLHRFHDNNHNKK